MINKGKLIYFTNLIDKFTLIRLLIIVIVIINLCYHKNLIKF